MSSTIKIGSTTIQIYRQQLYVKDLSLSFKMSSCSLKMDDVGLRFQQTSFLYFEKDIINDSTYFCQQKQRIVNENNTYC